MFICRQLEYDARIHPQLELACPDNFTGEFSELPPQQNIPIALEVLIFQMNKERKESYGTL